MLVQYLKDTETFALQVERAISVINSMLYWKTTSGRKAISVQRRLSRTRSIFTHSTTQVFGYSGPGGRAVLCDRVRVQRRQLGQRGEKDAATGLVN